MLRNKEKKLQFSPTSFQGQLCSFISELPSFPPTLSSTGRQGMRAAVSPQAFLSATPSSSLPLLPPHTISLLQSEDLPTGCSPLGYTISSVSSPWMTIPSGNIHILWHRILQVLQGGYLLQHCRLQGNISFTVVFSRSCRGMSAQALGTPSCSFSSPLRVISLTFFLTLHCQAAFYPF